MCRHVSLYSSYCQNFFLNTLATNGDRSRGRSCSRLQKEACIAIEHLHAELTTCGFERTLWRVIGRVAISCSENTDVASHLDGDLVASVWDHPTLLISHRHSDNRDITAISIIMLPTSLL